MNIQKYNLEQIQQARDNYDKAENRYRFFLKYGDKYPTIYELQHFYLVDNAERFAKQYADKQIITNKTQQQELDER